MKLALGHCFNLKNLFENFSLKRLKMSCKLCNFITGYTEHRDILIQLIFKDSVKLVIEDIIDNNVTFVFPNSLALIHMLKTLGDDFIQARLNGKWQDVDFIASMFTGYLLALTMYNRKGAANRVKPIYINRKLTDKITENTNNGKLYY